jgi:two-component system, cell cycle sensor histidine kinase and response regulator CckA
MEVELAGSMTQGKPEFDGTDSDARGVSATAASSSSTSASSSSSPSSSPSSSLPSSSSSFSSASGAQAGFEASAAETVNESLINKELRRLNRALRALSACNKALAQAGSEQELLDQICDIIVRLGGYRRAAIGYAMHDERKTVRIMAQAGYDGGYRDEIEVSWSADTPAGQGPGGIAIRENRICVISDTRNDPRFGPWREAALARGFTAVIALPLRVREEALGILAIYSEQPGSFESLEVELLTEIADNLAYGVTAIRSRADGVRVTAALREAEGKYRQLVEQVPAISYVAEAGVHGRFLYVSPQAKTILGYQPEDCLSDPHFWWDHLNPEDYPVAMEENTWEEGRPFQVEYRMRRQDGREVWLRDDAIIVRDPATGQRLTRGLLIDITERKGAEDALRRSEETYRMFVTQSAEGIYRTEHEPPVPLNLPLDEQIALSLKSGYIAECNDAMARMYGYKEARELIGARLSALLIADDPVTKEFMVEFLRPGYRITNWESHERDARGQTKIFRNSMIGIVEDGKLARTWGIQRDVTEQMHLEEQLRNAQQLEAIGRLAGGVAHDFNNILSIIMGHGELLLATAGLDDEGRNGVKQIRRAAERAAQLTQQLLAFSRKQVLQPKVLDLNDAVAEVQKMLARVIGEDVELGMKLHSALAPVKADPGQVEQVLMNLAINARDAMPHGGRLTMETSNMEMGSEQAREMGLANGRYVMLKVTDTGHGMDATTMSHIFEPFFTTKPVGKGTGLGLATVYGIVKQSGGGIRVESEVGRGAEFQIFLPAVQIENRNGSATKAGEKVGGGTETILLVEDEPDLRELARIFLEAYGYQVLEAESAEQAIELADGYPAPIHLLLTDVIMPGLSGRQLAESLLGKRADIRVVYMTGYTDDMVVQHKVLEPGVKLLQKPFTKSDLALKVRSTLDGK